MKTINDNLPEKPSDCFFYVALPPIANKSEEPGSKLIFKQNGQPIPVVLVDYLEYRLDCLSAFHCYAAYGMSVKQMRNYLQYKYSLKDSDRVAFYLFKKEQPQAEPTTTATQKELTGFID